MMQPADEIVTIVDAHNTVIGTAPRREMRAHNLPHRSTYVLVFNSQAQLYVQKRSLTKDLFPGYYDPATGGVVLAGENYEDSARRELQEELGIRDVPLTWHFAFYYRDERTQVWGGVFSCHYDGDIVLQAEEVESGTFLPIRDILRQAATEPYTPDSLYVLSRYVERVATASSTP
ncbi:putative Nudix hydrolase YfcD [Candidatus Entotheonellaceae bacterium PAL068K]